MGAKTIAFVEKPAILSSRTPNLVPLYLDINAFGTDFGDTHGLWMLYSIVQQVEEDITDMKMTAGSGMKNLWLFVFGVFDIPPCYVLKEASEKEQHPVFFDYEFLTDCVAFVDAVISTQSFFHVRDVS
jgi:hypothetical protein